MYNSADSSAALIYPQRFVNVKHPWTDDQPFIKPNFLPMKHFLLQCLLATLSISYAGAQSLLFNRTYPSPRYTDARAVLCTPDNGLVFTGLSKNASDTLGDMYLTKVNAAGAVQWTRYYTRNEEDGGNALLSTRDGGFLIVGHTALSYGISCDGYIVKTDAEGHETWRYFVGTAFDDVCDDVLQLADGSYLLTGRTENPATRTFQIMLCRISENGRQIFFKALETNTPAIGIKITAAPDGNILIAGYAYQPNVPNSEMLVLKCSPDGAILWQTQWGTPINDRAFAVASMPDGSCIAVGGASNDQDQPEQMLALHLDAGGRILSTATNLAGDGTGVLNQIIRNKDGRYYVCGVLKNAPGAPGKPVAGEITVQLDRPDWLYSEISSDCRTRCLQEDNGGNLIIGGNVQGPQSCTFLSKIETKTTAFAGVQVDQVPVLLFPNPFKTSTYLKVGNPDQRKYLTIVNMEGKTVRNTQFEASELFIERENLPAGCYIFNVKTAKGVPLCTGKLQID